MSIVDSLVKEIRSKPLIPETDDVIEYIKTHDDINAIDKMMEKFKMISKIRSKPLIPETDDVIEYIKTHDDGLYNMMEKFKMISKIRSKPLIPETDDVIEYIKTHDDINAIDNMMEKFKMISKIRSKPLIPETDDVIEYIKTHDDNCLRVLAFKCISKLRQLSIDVNDVIEEMKQHYDDEDYNFREECRRYKYIDKITNLEIDKLDTDLEFERVDLIRYTKTCEYVDDVEDKYNELRCIVEATNKWDGDKSERIRRRRENEMVNWIHDIKSDLKEAFREIVKNGTTDISIDDIIKAKALRFKAKFQ